jgi:Uma2 family endonuclease
MSSVSAFTISAPPFRSPGQASKIPPLENGDRLTRDEFMRRYEAMPEDVKAELIEGIVFMAAAVRQPYHSRPHIWLANVISTYGMRTGLDIGDNPTVKLDSNNAPQPDLILYLPAELGGRAKETEGGYLTGPPDLVCEVAASSVSIDLHEKLRAYEKNGVREYVVWRVLDNAVDWFVLDDGGFTRLSSDQHGVYQSRIFPGHWLNVPALLAKDAEQLWATLGAGMATDEYRDFAAKIKTALGKKG